MDKVEGLTVPIKQIIVLPGRGRKAFTQIESLADSLKTKGFIHPILVTRHEEDPDKFVLVAGERRYRAAILAGFDKIPVTFRDNLDPLQQKILELEENTARRDIDWTEQAETMRQIDELKQTEHKDGSWTLDNTAEFVQQSKGHVSLQINMAKKLKAKPGLKERVKHMPIRAALKVIEREEEVERVTRLKDSGQLAVSANLLLGDCRELIKKVETDSIDLLLTDPPYGLERMEELKRSGSVKMTGHQMMSETHNLSLAEVLDLLRSLAPELARVLKPGAHFYVFTAAQYVGYFIEALSPLEFQPPVVVWDRGKPSTPGYGYNYLSRTETIIYGHNPPRGKRLSKNLYNILTHPDVPSNLRTYPTEKPKSLLKELIEQSSIIGDLILDPFAGSASTLKAALETGRRGLGFEIDSKAWARAQGTLVEKPDDEG